LSNRATHGDRVACTKYGSYLISVPKQHISQLQDNFGLEYLVADSALYIAKTLKELLNIFWIFRVPATLNLAKEIIHAVAPNLMRDLEQKTFCSIEYRVRRHQAAMSDNLFT
jgi:transposase